MVSIIIRTQNRPGYLREALSSLRSQVYRDFEVILVVDGGNFRLDPTGYTDLRLHPILLPQPIGRSAAANRGLGAARGEFVGFLDDDDILYPAHLSLLAGALRGHRDWQVVYADALEAYQVPEVHSPTGYRTASRRLAYSWDFVPNGFRLANHIPNLCLLYRRGILRLVGGFDPALPHLDDWDLLRRLSQVTAFHHLKVTTAEYRVRSDSPKRTRRFFESAPYQASLARIVAKDRRR